MIQISEAASLALHSMMLLAQAENEPLSVDAIAARIDVSSTPVESLAEIEQVRARQGNRGPGGGYALSGRPVKSSLLEVYVAIDGLYRGPRVF